MDLKGDILRAARRKGIDPYTQPFTPKDLGLTPSDYGSFADYCSPVETTSGKWNKKVILRVYDKRPHRYLLIR